MRLAIVVLALLALVGCNTAESYKVQNIYPSALTQFPPGATLTGTTVLEDGQVQYELILPDGSFQTVIGPGNTGNFTVILNQNDGTEQTARGQVEAELSPTITGQGNATGGAETDTRGDLGDTVLPHISDTVDPEPVE